MKIKYSPESVEDLVRLRVFIAQHNPKAAAKAAHSIQKTIQHLKQFPQLGKAVKQAPEPDRIRDLMIENYCIRYLLGSDVIYVLRVWHQREDR